MELELAKLEFHATQYSILNALFFSFYGTWAYQARVPCNMELEFGKLEFFVLFFCLINK